MGAQPNASITIVGIDQPQGFPCGPIATDSAGLFPVTADGSGAFETTYVANVTGKPPAGLIFYVGGSSSRSNYSCFTFVQPTSNSNPNGNQNPDSIVPSATEIALEMSRTVESGSVSEHFTPGPTTEILDGSGGTLTAAVGVRSPTADGYGQLVFFWHNDEFLGWNASQETISIEQIDSPASGVFEVKYAQYAPSDPISSPSLPPVTITYRWTGSALESSGTPPNLIGSVKLLP
jgi:hypothetical protein